MTFSMTKIMLAVLTMSLLNDPPFIESWIKPIVIRNLSGIRHQSGLIEIVEENTCSDALVRLTCRLMHSFIYVLEAKYHQNRTSACAYNWQSWYEHKSLFARVQILQERRPWLVGYEVDDEEDRYYFIKTLNRRFA